MPDYPRAAIKNLEDAKSLLVAARWDGAGYHAGFVVECTLNALYLRAGGNPSNLPHGLNRLADGVNEIAGSKHGARKLAPGQFAVISRAGFHRWHPNTRYEAEGIISEAQARSWVQAANNFYHSVKP